MSDEELAHLYSSATVFVYPSLYEGFGLPPLEAMSCATAVIVSYASSIPEVCQDAAIYCDPKKPEDIAEKIMSVVLDDELRGALQKKGLQHSKRYSWDKAAQEHNDFFKSILWDT